jgi:type I restriction enzyme S subunit
MSPERLLRYFEQISEAPDAVLRLRRFILDLAVRGKLVEQDSQDEPVSELLKRIETEKCRPADRADIKKQNRLPMPKEDVVNFRLPTGWKLVPLGEVAICLDYRRVPINSEERLKAARLDR